MSDAMSTEELVMYAISEDVDLGDDVHDAKSEEAAQINNSGPDAQVEYLVEVHGHDYVQQMVTGSPPQ